MKTKAVFLGFGARAQSYANYLFTNENAFEIAAVAEPKNHLRDLAKEKYGCPENMLFEDLKNLLAQGVLGDLLFVCTQDNFHVEPAIAALKVGYRHLMVEKPIDKDIELCKKLSQAAKEYDAKVQVCHSLRYTSFYRKLKDLLDSGKIGQLISLNHIEPVNTFHYAHSFVRGDWSHDSSSPMILAKSCHDTDLLVWLTGKNCLSLSSYGALTFFKEKNAPEGATDRCIEACPHTQSCPYSATKYLTEYKEHLFREYAVEKEGFTNIIEALKFGRYGKCVYKCQNNVVDHQTVNMLFEDEITATFTMCAFSNFGRETHLMGSMGEIRAYMNESRIDFYDFSSGNTETYVIRHNDSLHSGADYTLVDDFVASYLGKKESVTPVHEAIQSHVMCIAAERSRLENRSVSLDEFA